MTKRRSTAIAALLALSAAFPADVSARTLGNPPAGSREAIGIASAESRPAAASDGGFAWGDAGVGAGAVLLAAGLGAGVASTAKGRRGRRLPAGSS